MKIKISILFIFIFILNIRAQQNSYDFFQVTHDTTNYPLLFKKVDDHYLLKKKYSSDTKNDTIDIKIKNLEIQEFQNAFRKIYSLPEQILSIVSTKLFSEIVKDHNKVETKKRLENLNLSQKIPLGIIKIRDTTESRISVYHYFVKSCLFDILRKDSLYFPNNHAFILDTLEIAFENAQMKDISATGKLFINKKDTVDVQFRNNSYPPIRTPAQISKLNSRGMNYLEYIDEKSEEEFHIDLFDLIEFERKIYFGTGNYIPPDTVIVIDRKTNKRSIIYKKEVNDIFDIRLYTDVTGFQEDNPNGLVQFEGRLNLIITNNSTKLVPFHKITPYLSFNKIEKKLKYLSPEVKYFDTFFSKNTTSIADLIRYSNFDIGSGINLFTYFAPASKINFDFNFGFMQTSIDSSIIFKKIDNSMLPDTSLIPERDIELFHIGGGVNLTYIDGYNLSFESGIELNRYFLLGKNIELELSGKKDVLKFFMGINIFTSPESKSKKAVFFRFTYISDLNWDDNILQLQIGYSTPLSELF